VLDMPLENVRAQSTALKVKTVDLFYYLNKSCWIGVGRESECYHLP